MNQARIIFISMITMVIMLTQAYAAGTRTDIINRWVRASDNIPAKALRPADAAPLKHIGKADPVHNPVPRHLDAPHNTQPNQNINKAIEVQPSVIAKPIDQNAQARSALDLRKSAAQLQNGKQREEVLGAAKKAEDRAATLRHQNLQQQSDKRYFEKKTFQEKKGLEKRQAEQKYIQKSNSLSKGSATNRNTLNKQLASDQQLDEVGTIMAGGDGRVPFRDAGRIANVYGGSPSDWVKKASLSHVSPDGTRFEAHWVENLRTGQRVEFKTKFSGE